jgi:hypothetical protein
MSSHADTIRLDTEALRREAEAYLQPGRVTYGSEAHFAQAILALLAENQQLRELAEEAIGYVPEWAVTKWKMRERLAAVVEE